MRYNEAWEKYNVKNNEIWEINNVREIMMCGK